ncbi:LPXTG-motif cell wall anchor domain-containing protein [Georgenia satyanarayanai]|uniref:LPXTG-motif cell wall anchor domain-containing protein n=1 Tax=Georgenia satyanarayanai TaxID=860221 RepID=A0A2Y9AME9_9MICO|nr:choice-of-anchor I family protein [Georgenia satyanarayanai]PYF97800.1 LPXTG-motif cell wall-anchored protein [Georgenia satyanarayanai]SSA45540.1 LPXTG-motif cell wall anchor domain-containing protein [Georgenia satyanarayanai]
MPTSPSLRRTAAATTALAAVALTLPALTAGAATVPVSVTAGDAAFELTAIGTYESGVFDESAAEIVTFHAATQRLFVVNAAAATVDVLDLSDPAAPALLHRIETPGTAAADGSTVTAGAVANSVAVRADGLGVIAVEHPTKTEPGWLVAFDAAGDGELLGAVRVGPLPDMVTTTADGRYAVVANEGEPADDFTADPEGSVAVVTLPASVAAPTQDDVRTAGFHAWDDGTRVLPVGVRVFGPTPHGEDLPVSRNLEPEYVTIGADDRTAYVALQEANAVAVVDLGSATVSDLWPLGLKDHSVEGNGLDPSDRDPEDAPTINIRTYPGVRGVYMPDGMASYTAGGQTYLVTANEGDAREWGDYVESVRVKDLGDPDETPAPAVCEDAPVADFLGDEHLGRLNVSIAGGLAEDGSCFEELHAFGGRSLSIWTTDGEQVFDTGDELERITAAAVPEFFNSNHSESTLEGRSEDKGPEPENLAIGEVDGRTYAFLGLERVGGVVVHDITDPTDAFFVTYLNNRDFSVSMEDVIDAEPGTDAVQAALTQAGDLGPEGVTFIPAADSGTGLPLVAVGNEVSGTTTIFSVGRATPVVPATVEFTDGDGTEHDVYTVPAVDGVEYLVDGAVVAAGTYPGTGTVTVVARALPGFVLDDGASAEWTWTFSAEGAAAPAPAEPAPSPEPTTDDAGDDATAGGPNGRGSLPTTGSSVGVLGAAAGVLLALGAAAVLARRRATAS